MAVPRRFYSLTKISTLDQGCSFSSSPLGDSMLIALQKNGHKRKLPPYPICAQLFFATSGALRDKDSLFTTNITSASRAPNMTLFSPTGGLGGRLDERTLPHANAGTGHGVHQPPKIWCSRGLGSERKSALRRWLTPRVGHTSEVSRAKAILCACSTRAP